MLEYDLNFAPGTEEVNQRLIMGLLTPRSILDAYREVRRRFGGRADIVLEISEQDPSGFSANVRADYIKKKRRELRPGQRWPILMEALRTQSAQQIMSLPAEAEAMWFIVNRGLQKVPIMCVLYVTEVDVEAAS